MVKYQTYITLPSNCQTSGIRVAVSRENPRNYKNAGKKRFLGIICSSVTLEVTKAKLCLHNIQHSPIVCPQFLWISFCSARLWRSFSMYKTWSARLVLWYHYPFIVSYWCEEFSSAFFYNCTSSMTLSFNFTRLQTTQLTQPLCVSHVL